MNSVRSPFVEITLHLRPKPDSASGSLHIDISVNSPDGVKLVPIMEKYLDSMPALRYLVLVVKGYLSQLRLNSAQDGGLSSYSLMCLVISFLQVSSPHRCHRKTIELPLDLQRNPKQRPTDDIEKPLEYESLGRLLMDFLDHYGNEFDYAESCVSVTQGKVVSKKSKGWDQTSQSDHLSIECLVNSSESQIHEAKIVNRSSCRIHRLGHRPAYRED